jgi:hypothetical protein
MVPADALSIILAVTRDEVERGAISQFNVYE